MKAEWRKITGGYIPVVNMGGSKVEYVSILCMNSSTATKIATFLIREILEEKNENAPLTYEDYVLN